MRTPLLLAGLLLLPACNRERAPSDGSEPAKDPEPRHAPESEPESPPSEEDLELPPEADEPEIPEGPKIAVNLPASPAFADAHAAEKHPGGEWSVAGLRTDVDARVAEGNAGEEVEAVAWVQEIYVPPTCPVGDVCPPPKQPHVWVVDDRDDNGKRNAMLVVNYRFMIPEWDAKSWEDQPEVVLEVGKRYTFKGKFKRFSDTGFAHDRGLLEFVAVRYEANGPWVYPPGAPWHPLEIARQEEANRELAERAAEHARKRKR